MSREFFVIILWTLRIYSYITVVYCIYILTIFDSLEVLKVILPVLVPAVAIGGIASVETWLIKIIESIIDLKDNIKKK